MSDTVFQFPNTFLLLYVDKLNIYVRICNIATLFDMLFSKGHCKDEREDSSGTNVSKGSWKFSISEIFL